MFLPTAPETSLPKSPDAPEWFLGMDSPAFGVLPSRTATLTPDNPTPPPTDEERRLSERGAAIVAAAMARPEAQAPHRLRESLVAPHRSAPHRRWGFGTTRGRLAGAGAALLAAAAVAIAVVGSDGDTLTGPPVTRVAALGRLTAQASGPPVLDARAATLDAKVGTIRFPDWTGLYGWRATGQREDELDGRRVGTVFYTNPAGVQIGYSIVAGPALEAPRDASPVTRGTTTYHVTRHGKRTTVSWTQSGQTCVMDAPASVPSETLVELAAWTSA